MNPIKKIYISIVTFGILSILLIVFLISPLFREIKENSEELLLQKKKLILLARERENLKKVEDIYKTYQLELNKIEKVLVDPEVPVEFISFLETASEASEVELEISSMAKQDKKEDLWPSLSLQILVSGSFPNFLEFLEKLETSSYLIEILNLNSRRLTERELKSREYEEFSLGDTLTSLSIKVFTK